MKNVFVLNFLLCFTIGTHPYFLQSISFNPIKSYFIVDYFIVATSLTDTSTLLLHMGGRREWKRSPKITWQTVYRT
jgi:hypothetical protein